MTEAPGSETPGTETPGTETRVRDATDADMAALREIYAHHVLHGLASFEETPPDVADLSRRRDDILAHGLPYLVAETRGRVLGYAYAAPFRPRPAYRYTVENSVYVAPEAGRRGIGSLLLKALIQRCTQRGIRQMVAVIGDTDNHPSIDLHAKLGFQRVGGIRSVGFKFGRWVDSVYMQLSLGDGDSTLPG